MKVILLKDVENLGEEGEIKTVADGYGRNFLLPRGFDILASKHGLNLIEQRKAKIEARKEERRKAATGPLQLTVAPEGSRSKTRYWKTGFYHIAVGAQVPIVMAYLDYGSKVGGLGPVFQPSGDVEADMAAIKTFYAPFKGKNADQFHAE